MTASFVPREPLAPSVRRRRRIPSPEARVAAQLVGVAMGQAADAILSDMRGAPEAAFARQVVMYVLNTARGLSIADVAAVVGRDRSTVAHALRVVEERREEGHFDDWLSQLEDAVRRAPMPGEDGEAS